jgi:hypothetical protein
MKNYYSDTERKFTIAKLEVRKFNSWDIVILLTFSLIVIINLFLTEHYPQKAFFLTCVGSFLTAYLIFTTPFGLRLRNINFSVIWLLLSLLFLYENYAIAQIPLLGFLIYHFFRLVFWKKYNKEFIPYESGRGRLFRYVSKVEGRGGYKEDRAFMKLLIAVGFGVFIYGIYTMISIKF